MTTTKSRNKRNQAVAEKKISSKKRLSAPKTVKKVIRKELIVPEKCVSLRAEEPQVRYLKVQPVYRHLANRTRIVPELRLNGCWLEQAGFGSASYVSITVMNGLLIIRSTSE